MIIAPRVVTTEPRIRPKAPKEGFPFPVGSLTPVGSQLSTVKNVLAFVPPGSKKTLNAFELIKIITAMITITSKKAHKKQTPRATWSNKRARWLYCTIHPFLQRSFFFLREGRYCVHLIRNDGKNTVPSCGINGLRLRLVSLDGRRLHLAQRNKVQGGGRAVPIAASHVVDQS